MMKRLGLILIAGTFGVAATAAGLRYMGRSEVAAGPPAATPLKRGGSDRGSAAPLACGAAERRGG